MPYFIWHMAYEIWHMKSDYTSECSPRRLNILSVPSGFGRLFLMVAACVLSSSCAKSPPPQRVEEKPLPPQALLTADTPAIKSAPDIPAAKPEEVKQTIDRVFKGAVTIKTEQTPYFSVGDFNGDLSQDLAVVVKPTSGKLLEINDELAPWMIGEPIQTAKPDPRGLPYANLHAEKMKRRQVVIDERDNLVAIIHGFQSKGWRDSQATQTYVLKNAAGSKMEAQTPKQIVWAGNKDKLPRILGDVIAQSVNERYGFLYYNGAMYSWYDPRSFKPEAPKRIIHGGGAKAMR
jgi:hypothetical protein